MKSKEEILNQINFFIAPSKKEQIFTAMEEYATQCQEDMADKKYTEEDMLQCWNACLDFNKPAGLDSGINYKDYINSLNKQD